MNPADVLEAAADALWMHGRCRGVGTDRDGRMCVLGAIVHVQGGDAGTWAGMSYTDRAAAALGFYLGAHPEVVPGDSAVTDPAIVAALLGTDAPFVPPFLWNDRLRDDELAIDTLRRCAKDLRNGEA